VASIPPIGYKRVIEIERDEHMYDTNRIWLELGENGRSSFSGVNANEYEMIKRQLLDEAFSEEVQLEIKTPGRVYLRRQRKDSVE